MPSDLLSRKSTHFVLWRPLADMTAPVLVIGTFQFGNPPTLAAPSRSRMTLAPGVTGLWQIAAADCGLADGTIYHYWFEVTSAKPNRPGGEFSALIQRPGRWTGG